MQQYNQVEETTVTCEQCGCKGNNFIIPNGTCISCQSDIEREFYENYDEEQDRIF